VETTIIRSLALNFAVYIYMTSRNPAITSMHIEKLAQEFDSKTAQEVLRWALDTFGTKIALASSFGAEDVVIIDMMANLDKNRARVFTLDTGRLNQETYDVMDEIRARYGIPIEVYFPDHNEVEEMVRARGMNLMYESVENRKLCCEIRKVHPLKRALSTLDGWITGLRRNQVVTRATTKKVEIDRDHGGIVKVNPLADWTSDMVWDYIRKNNVPYNKLHDIGFPSIGCEPCTRAIKPGEDPRAGRWWWESAAQKECGIHFDPSKRRRYTNSSSSSSS
jgi:phosphoadenosine phosphosulfate reductase